jgi:hypothetical protein
MGLTGALLLLSGLVYAVIGIKNKWYVDQEQLLTSAYGNRIYVFGSAAYLTALAVTVLIVYLMNPPVSDGVQGAFFVAAFVTGVIFGVLSLVFADITDGFGCLLGGFCLSMWFLSLRNGGLISSTTGRAIFIGCMSAGSFSLSFSHYTRTYGLIGSIAFSGATATMLGIDCLTCAGWKEFWLYLWSLNGDIFPLNTNTYPVTKNIKAELAGVVIITVFGVVSQLRVWKLVKERRAKSAAHELERQQERDREEEARGRSVEDNVHKERTQWEATYGAGTYGNKSIPDSSVRSSSIASPKGSASIRERELYAADSMELVELSKSGVAPAGTSATVSGLRDDDIQQIDAHGNPVHADTLPAKVDQVSVTKRTSLRSAVPPSPSVVPLPFTVQEARTEDADTTPVAAVPELHHEPRLNRRSLSKRISDMSATRHLSMHRDSRGFTESAEALVDAPHIEEDRTSSVAATLDEDDDNTFLHQNPTSHSPFDSKQQAIEDASISAKIDPNGEPLPQVGDSAQPEAFPTGAKLLHQGTAVAASPPSRPRLRQSLTASTDPKPNEAGGMHHTHPLANTLVDDSKSGSEQGQQSKSSRSDAQSQSSLTEQVEPIIMTEDVLPQKLSKVALSYRTNEWAKHLEAADRPDLDDVHLRTSHVILEEGSEEKAAPVSDEIAAPLHEPKRYSGKVFVDSRFNSNSGFALNRSTSTFSQDSLVDQRALTQSPATTPVDLLVLQNSEVRPDVLAPLPGNTLMGKRESLMRKRTSSHSFTPTTSATNLLQQAEMENLSLAQRRQILQHHQATSPVLQHKTSGASQRNTPPLASEKWQKKGIATKGVVSGFNSHQPKRTSSAQSDQKREQLYAGWRDTVRDITPPQTQNYSAEQQRVALMNEKRQTALEKQQHESTKQQRASMMDSMMRSGHMLDAHREAMRKMQANANRNAS